MNISIFGLGYVGCVSAGCLANMGHKVIGVDISKVKIDLINNGKATIVEENIDPIILKAYNKSLLIATDDANFAVQNSEISIICVGTPNKENGELDTSHLETVCFQIAHSLKNKKKFHIIVIRSTVIPGTSIKLIRLIEKYSGKKINIDFGFAINPEFLREGTAVYDFYNPPMTVIGSESEKVIIALKKLYKEINAPIEIVNIGVAEMIKMVNNSFHALKVAFANEVSCIAKSLKVDSNKLMELFVMDTKLNLSKYYFKPGFAYGGSCLPKDLKALNTISYGKLINTPVISNIENSNQAHIKRAIDKILSFKLNEIGILGISFKEGTDDMRNSPIIDVIEFLIGKGYKIMLYDKNVELSSITGKNKEFIVNKIPHIAKYIVSDAEKFIKLSKLIVVNSNDKEIFKKLKNTNKKILDLKNNGELKKLKYYYGLCW